nr:N-6 DNA methylase [uncultured Blautia sp.]
MNKKCQVFTPENYVKELLDSVGYIHDLYGKTILENSCGDGNILVTIVYRYIDDCLEKGLSRSKIKSGLENDIYGIEIDEEQYKKCISNLDEVLKRKHIGKVAWKIINYDYLKWDTTMQFQYIVGNPPYITYSELKEEEQTFVKSNFKTCVDGKFDYCYAFIEKSINLLANNGKMSYLIPSSIFKTVFGNNLRIYMSRYIDYIKDYTQIKIFDKALVKSSIMVLDKQRQHEILHYRDMNLGIQIEIPINCLGEKWVFSDENKNGQYRFGHYFKVSHVVATLFNKAYILQHGKYTETDEGYIYDDHIIEKAVVRDTETPRTLRYGKKEKILFPYAYNENGLVRFKNEEFEKLFPGATAHLNIFREELDKRKIDNNAKWYEYGRSQALRGLNRVKLLISTVVTDKVEVYKLSQECIPYAGMYIVEKEDNNEYTLDDAIQILTSAEFRKYALRIGIPISGRSVRITSKDIENYMF